MTQVTRVRCSCNWFGLLLLLFQSALSSCVNLAVSPIGDFGELSKKPADSSPPKLFFMDDAPAGKLPSLVLFAIIGASVDSMVERDSIARDIWRKADKLGADVVLVENANVGAVPLYQGLGAATARAYRGFCYKRASFRIGVNWNKDSLVVACSNEAKASGLLEGDTLLSVDGLSVQSEGNNLAPYFQLNKTIRPGDELTLVWIRPGVGRMEGKMRALENPPIQLQLPDSISWSSLPAPSQPK